jgi:hypothetical protein
MGINNKLKKISYEIYCATPRILPINAYLDFEVQPAAKSP